LVKGTQSIKKVERALNEKTPVISRSLFINQKTNSHENAVTRTKYKQYANIPTWEYFNIDKSAYPR